jgi:hypothetical protein
MLIPPLLPLYLILDGTSQPSSPPRSPPAGSSIRDTPPQILEITVETSTVTMETKEQDTNAEELTYSHITKVITRSSSKQSINTLEVDDSDYYGDGDDDHWLPDSGCGDFCGKKLSESHFCLKNVPKATHFPGKMGTNARHDWGRFCIPYKGTGTQWMPKVGKSRKKSH